MTEDLRKLLDEAGPAMDGLRRITADDWSVDMPGYGGWTFVGKRENHPRLIVIETGFGASADRRQDAIERLCIMAPDLARKHLADQDRIAALEAEVAPLRGRGMAAGVEAEPVAGWPERIWADQDNLTWVEADPNEVMRGDEVCYIRADLAHPSGAESLWAEVNRLTAEVEVAWKGERDQWLHDYDAMTKKRDAALARVAELEAALATIEDLNKTGADENGHRWDHSDLIAQEIMGARGAITPQPDAGLEAAIREAIDLMTERTQGSPARSASHNARLVLEAALRSRPVGEVKLKPIDWSGGLASTPIGDYVIAEEDWDEDPFWFVIFNGKPVSRLGEHKDEASAIAAAQADYEARIRAALSGEGKG
ncbi:hypothetical protein [Pseudogemmobacter sonorensis]|uniref:hypothetical protein n=1 Tax=Pseudogemmobacter sonorensis TaxID=2989681 RepID=UPI0036A51BA4